MTFAPVKSDPYKRKARRPKPKARLWPESVWDAIVDRATNGLDWLDIVIEANRRLYGDKAERINHL